MADNKLIAKGKVATLCVALGACVCQLGSAEPAAAEISLTPHTAEYDVKFSVLGGRLTTELLETPDGYIATHIVRPTGFARMLAHGQIRESSHFHRQFTGIRPVLFETNDSLTRDKVNASIKFDWVSGEAIGTVNDEDFAFDVANLAYDRVSIQYELMSDMLNDEEASQYILFDIDELKTIEVSRIGKRDVTVPAGRFEAVGMQHQEPGSKRVTTMWCVKELDYLPVIIEQHRKGKLKMRAVLSNYARLET